MESYERPAIAERTDVGDPLIVGLYASPVWRPAPPSPSPSPAAEPTGEPQSEG
jgi:hypothetical protein